ncbi:ABC transporter substrate-binding protein [Robbsia sp. KACC 23696]|uniref:ABC transporter substrate-binding protein n=1 Tax=Robbsia sp. KACC 23696 TaxID=3149231 RepID=UPI00325AA44C
MKRFVVAMMAATSLALALSSVSAHATQYPVTVTDTAGRKVTIDQEPQRVVIQDGRDILTMALLDRADPFKRLVTWNNLIKNGDPDLWKTMTTRWPDAAKVPDMNFSDQGNVNLETIISKQPQLIIAQLRAKSAFEQSGVFARMAQLHIPIVFVDSEVDPVGHTAESVTLLGKVLNREKEANEYVDFYNQHLQHVEQTIAAITTPRPRVFVEAKAGFSGPDCCFTHATVGYGQLLKSVKAVNIGAELLHTPSGSVSMESVIGAKPDVYIMTGKRFGKNSTSIALPFGYGGTQAEVDAAFAKLEARPGFMQTKAAMDGQIYGIYHLFYNHAYNIVGIEYLAKILYPKQFAQLDPTADWNTIMSKFTTIPAEPLILEAKAPAKQ